VAAALVLLVGGAVAWQWMGRSRASATTSSAASSSAASPSPAPSRGAATPAPQVPAPAPGPTLAPGPKMVGVLVDTIPPRAWILRDGKQVSDTPEEIEVPEQGTVTLALHRDGYRDAEVTLDPRKSRKVVVRLDRARGGEAHAHAAMPPAPSRPKTRRDPYELLDRRDEPLDPYR